MLLLAAVLSAMEMVCAERRFFGWSHSEYCGLDADGTELCFEIFDMELIERSAG